MSTTPDSCELSLSIVQHWSYIVGQIWQIGLCFITVGIEFTWRKYILQKLINQNAKILMTAILLSLSAHALVFSGTQIHHLIFDILVAKSSCDVIFSNFNCLYVKCFIHCFNINVPLLLLCSSIERTIATYYHHNYSTKDFSIIFKILPVLTLTASFTYTGIIFYVDAYDTFNTASCLFNTPTSWLRVNIMYYALIGINTPAMIWMSILYCKNRQMENKISSSLAARYQVKENLHITKIIVLCGTKKANKALKKRPEKLK